jgi:hypothetical protein
MKILCRIYGPTWGRGQWRKRNSRQLEELYNEPKIINIIKYSRLRWVGHVVLMDETELPKKISLTNPGGQWRCGQPKSRWIDEVEEDPRKVVCRKWLSAAQDRGHSDMCLRRPRPAQGCRTDDDDDYFYDRFVSLTCFKFPGSVVPCTLLQTNPDELALILDLWMAAANVLQCCHGTWNNN